MKGKVMWSLIAGEEGKEEKVHISGYLWKNEVNEG